MKFGLIKDENLNEVEMTESNYANYIRSNDRRVRKESFTRMFETYASYKNTIAKTFAGNVEYLTSMAKIRKFKSSLEASLFYDNVSVDVYNNLIETVHDNMNVIYKYFDLKKDILKLDELHLYDIYVELVDTDNKDYTIEEAREIIMEALNVLGDDYTNTLNRAFEERWIDVFNNVGKRSGAYSSGFYDTNPFILLNYEGKLRDVLTLAHEGGHSMHTYYSCKNNPYHDSSYKIFVAEVASTVNELLVLKHLYNKTNDEKLKLSILNELMELFKSTIYRQVMFSEFEKNMHALKEKGEVLTSELLNEEYYKLNKLYFGPSVVVDDLISYEWERIPHFYYDFYVYKYAIGLSSACYIVNNILSGKKGAKEAYLNFLKSGGSDYPTEELKIAGVDVTKSEVILSAIKMFDETIDDFKILYKKVYN
jgi:oligoendopeptidase F